MKVMQMMERLEILEKMEAKGESPAFKEKELVVCEDLDFG